MLQKNRQPYLKGASAWNRRIGNIIDAHFPAGIGKYVALKDAHVALKISSVGVNISAEISVQNSTEQVLMSEIKNQGHHNFVKQAAENL